MAGLPRNRGPAPGWDRGSGRRHKISVVPPGSASFRGNTILHKFSALHGVEHRETPPGLRLAPALNPGRVLRVLDLNIPAFGQPFFHEDALPKPVIVIM